MSPTQHLRNLLDLASIGAASIDDLHNELLTVEQRLGLPLTHPAESEVAA